MLKWIHNKERNCNMELITSSQIYWLTRLDPLEGLFVLMFVLGLFPYIVSLLIYLAGRANGDEEVAATCKKISRITLPVWIIGILGMTFVPNTKEAAAIWVVPKVVNNDQMQSIGTNSLQVVELGLKCLQDRLTGKDGD